MLILYLISSISLLGMNGVME